MKKIMTMACALLMAVAAQAQSVATVPFSQTKINVPAHVNFVRGNRFAFSVTTEDISLARQLKCTVKNGVLSMSFGNGLNAGEVQFDENTGAFTYGVPARQSDTTLSEDHDILFDITIVSPAMPSVKTSGDYQAYEVVNGELNELALLK